MIKTHSNFWNSFEIDCVARDFSYDSYIELHTRSEQQHAPVRKYSYDLLKTVFNFELENDQNLA